MLLRSRQEEFVEKSIKALKEHNNTLSVAFTGAGKTICFSAVIKQLTEETPGYKTLVIAHRKEITHQNQDKFKVVAPNISTSLFNGSAKDWSGRVVFGMIQSISRPAALENMPKFDLIVIDEAHHIATTTYTTVLKQSAALNRDVKIFGVTATPKRGDNKDLGFKFLSCADEISLGELIKSGHLVPPICYRLAFDSVEKQLQELQARAKTENRGQDFINAETALILNTEPLNYRVVEEWKRYAEERKTVIFCSDIKHAAVVNDAFQAKGYNSAVLTGDMKDLQRERIFRDLQNGNIQVLVNVAILTEGWDYPPISCVVLLRCSSYKSTMIQMIGRGLRPIDPLVYPEEKEKTDCIVLDFGISLKSHGDLDTNTELRSKKTMQSIICIKCKNRIPATVTKCPLCAERQKDFECPHCSKQVLYPVEVCPHCDNFIQYVNCNSKECTERVPVHISTCLFCKTDQRENKEKRKEFVVKQTKEKIESFHMKEINILKECNFLWETLLPDEITGLSEPSMITAGFRAWCFVFSYDTDKWAAIGGSKSDSFLFDTQVLYKGAKLCALSRSNDFMNVHENSESAQKVSKWMSEEATDAQIELLDKCYVDQHNMLFKGGGSKGRASLVITYCLKVKPNLDNIKRLVYK